MQLLEYEGQSVAFFHFSMHTVPSKCIYFNKYFIETFVLGKGQGCSTFEEKCYNCDNLFPLKNIFCN